MGMCVLIMGESGAGKTASLRNFERNECIVFSVAGKRLPFKKKLNTINLRNMASLERYEVIKEMIIKYKDKCKTFVIDDSQYLMGFEELSKVFEKGYQKFTEMAVHFTDLLNFIASLNDNIVVYLLQHVEKDEDGRLKAKTVGKMIDSKITLEGLFETVILAENNEGNYCFRVKNNGLSTCKTPMGMFESETIDNDLKSVDETIRNYFEIKEKTKKKEKKENDTLSN